MLQIYDFLVKSDESGMNTEQNEMKIIRNFTFKLLETEIIYHYSCFQRLDLFDA